MDLSDEQAERTGCDLIALDAAYKRGDLDAVKAALGHPPDFPNCRGPQAAGKIILEYAIYHSPLPFIRTLLELGADSNYGDPAGFPSLLPRCRLSGRTSTKSSNCCWPSTRKARTSNREG